VWIPRHTPIKYYTKINNIVVYSKIFINILFKR